MKKIFLIGILISFLCACASTPKCNIYVIDELSKKDIYIPEGNANQIYNYLSKSPDWQTAERTASGRLNHPAAYAAAKDKKTVVAAYHSGSKASGHVVTVYGKKKMAYSPAFGAEVPYVKGSRNGSKPTINLLSYQFSAKKEPRMNYFIYKK